MMKRKTSIQENILSILFFVILLTTTLTGSGQGIPVESPEKEGLSPERLNRIDVAMNNYVQSGKMPGMTVGLTPTEGTIGEMIKVQTYFSGGAGLVSTASDYSRFAQMLLNNGELDGKRILSRKTVELMTSNSIGDIMVSDGFRRNGLGDKFGYGFWIDPKEDLVGIFLSQVDNYWSEKIIDKFRVLVYQSISD